MKFSKSLLLLSLGLLVFSQAMAENTDKTTASQESAIHTDTKKAAPTIDKKIKHQNEQEMQDNAFSLDEQADEYFGQPDPEQANTDKNK